MSQISSENKNQKEFIEENININTNTPAKNIRKYSLNSSSDSESFYSNINEEIKAYMENEDSLSFSSNSEHESPIKKDNLDYLFEPRFWRPEKNYVFDNEYNQEKKIIIKNGIKEESNKQSTQGNEDEEIRNEQMHNNSLSESNENEINSDKIIIKKDKNFGNISQPNKEQKIKIDNNKNNLNGTNILINGSNFTNNITFKNTNGYPKFIFPYDHINYITNQNASNYFPGSYLSNNFGNFNTNYNLPSPIDNKNIISLNNSANTNLTKLLNDKKETNIKQDIKNNNNNKDLSLNNNNHNNTINYNTPKLNVNMTYYPKLQNNEIINKQTIENKINNQNANSNLSSELKSPSLNNNIKSNKKTNNKDNSSSNEIKNNTANNNIKMENNSKNNINNKPIQIINKNIVNININLNNNTKNAKCEKLFLNLDDIASGKDMRTTIMIRNIPIKYTENILNETFKEFHGKYDCLYMPYDYEKKGNKGYAFINFINPLHILLFYEKFNGKKWIHFESSKICELNMAHFQGVNEIQKHAKNYKELKKACFSKSNDKIVIPSKYLPKLKKRFPKMKYSENSSKKEFEILSFN